MTDITGSKKVAYLIGAGGSHACVKTLGSSNGILMSDLARFIQRRPDDEVANVA